MKSTHLTKKKKKKMNWLKTEKHYPVPDYSPTIICSWALLSTGGQVDEFLPLPPLWKKTVWGKQCKSSQKKLAILPWIWANKSDGESTKTRRSQRRVATILLSKRTLPLYDISASCHFNLFSFPLTFSVAVSQFFQTILSCQGRHSGTLGCLFTRPSSEEELGECHTLKNRKGYTFLPSYSRCQNNIKNVCKISESNIFEMLLHKISHQC